jgi:hypothetical protein
MFLRYLNLAILASTAFSQYALESPNSNNMARELADEFPVMAYICENDNSVVGSPAALAQGSFLQVCVKIDEAVVTDNILVEDILTFVVSQPDGISTDSEIITNAVADPLTNKVCRESGICNVNTQLLSKFFTEAIPGDLRVDGVAILAFGQASIMPSPAPTAAPIARRLRAVPIRGLFTGDDVKAFMAAQQKNLDKDESGISVVSVFTDSSQRMLQEGANQSNFGVEVVLNGVSGDQGSSSGGVSAMVVAVIVLHLLAAGCGLLFFFCIRKRRKQEPKDDADHHSSNSSIGTYPCQASVYTSSSSQHVSHRTRVEEFD